MNTLSRFIAAATFVGSTVFSTASIGQTPMEDFLNRAHNMEFNTSVLTTVSSSTNDVQMLMGQPTTRIDIDLNSLFSLTDFQIELPGLENIHAIQDYITPNQVGGNTWVGDVILFDSISYTTSKQGRAYFVESEEGITGAIHTPNEIIQIRPDGNGGQLMAAFDPSYYDLENDAVALADSAEEQVAASPSIAGRRDGPNIATLSNPYTIDVLWVTTLLARESGENMESLIALTMATANDILVNSEIPAQLRSVGVHHNTTYSETADDMNQTLSDIRIANNGHVDEIHQIRTDLGADLVHIVAGATNYCGLAYVDSRYATGFGATKVSCMGGYVAAHEIGHNLGALHDKFQGGSDSWVYEFGHGTFNETVAPYWRTVMSYSCRNGTSCPTINYFSNPDLSYEGMTIGSEEEFNNSRVWRVRVAEVAGFAPSVVSGCTEHTDTNSNHVNAGRAITRIEGETCFGTFCFGGTTYYDALGSGDVLGTSGTTNTTLAEQPVGYFSLGNCGAITEDEQFAPEVQNLNPEVIDLALHLQGEVFDANADVITHVDARVSGQTTWSEGSINGSDFQVNIPGPLTPNTSIDIRTEDINGNTFEFTTTFELDLETTEVPTITDASYEITSDGVVFSVSASDPEGDDLTLHRSYDGNGQGTLSNGSNTWSVIWLDPAVGDHTATFTVVDSAGNESESVTLNFTIDDDTVPCFIDTNSNHVSAGRAETIKEGETCFGTFCFGGTDTYYAIGSNDNLGTSASVSNSLIESSPGYFELGACADTTAPEITIPGGLNYQVAQGASFSNPAAQATDNVDGDISASVAVTGSVNTSSIGTYYLYYNVSDAAGNAADEVVVTVEVVDQPTSQCFTSTLSEHVSAGRAYDQYYSYYATGTATYLGSTFNDANKVISLEEASSGNWSEVASCN
ncbi:MAG: DUF5011 domain-containing protein [Agarilytica sp.]